MTPAPGGPVPLIYNPAAGGGRGAVRFRDAEALLALRGVAVQPMETQAPGHATDIARRLCAEGHDVIYAMGGDGTFSEVSEGVLSAKARPLLGFIPAGTGNDFLREFGPLDRRHAIERIAAGRVREIDAAVVRFQQDGQPRTRHGINIFGTGLAAQAADLTNRRLKWAGPAAYNLGVLWRIMSMRPQPTRLELDGQEREGDFPLVVACNSIHTGNAMKMAPMAKPDDGLLDVLSVEDVSRRELLGLLMKVRSGAHVRHPKVRFHRARRVRIEPKEPSPLLIDGEVMGSTPVELEVLPGALRILL